jgi:hypothetical protein
MARYRRFMFNWKENKVNSVSRNNLVQAADAKSATDIFMREFGNLKKNTINFIQEVNMAGEPINEKIIPE